MIVQISALVALAAWFILIRDQRAETPFDWPVLIGAALFAAVPLIQLVPLPPSIWQSLPARETEVAALRLIGAENSWRPLSIAPYRTLASALSLIAPLVMIYFVSQLSLRDRTRLLAVLVALICLSAAVGAIQQSSGDSHWLRFYPGTANRAFATGFHANRNSAADLFAIGIVALATFLAIRSDLLKDLGRRALAGGILAFLLIAILLTGSRSGMGLGLLAVAVSALMFASRFRWKRRTVVIGAAAATVMVGLLLFAARDNAVVQKSLDRFNSLQDARPNLWEDTRYAIGTSWPAGTGMGTFVPVIISAEQLEFVDASRPNRAHNDYLEFTLEAGILGLIVVLMLTIGLMFRTWNVLRDPQTQLEQRRLALFALTVLVILALHSIVDYPLRSMSLATLCALAVGMLARTGGQKVGTRLSQAPLEVRSA